VGEEIRRRCPILRDKGCEIMEQNFVPDVRQRVIVHGMTCSRGVFTDDRRNSGFNGVLHI